MSINKQNGFGEWMYANEFQAKCQIKKNGKISGSKSGYDNKSEQQVLD